MPGKRGLPRDAEAPRVPRADASVHARSSNADLVLERRRDEPGTPERGILGYCVIETVADEVHVHNLAVRPEARGGGVGRRLLEVGLAMAGRRGARVALLEVRESNQAAIELYRSLGFVAVGTRRNYYSQPLEDALLLRKEGLAEGDHP